MHFKVLLTVVLLATPAFASEDRFPLDDTPFFEFAQPGWYVEAAGLGLFDAFAGDTSAKGGGVFVAGGYRVNAWYAFQLEAQWGRMTADASGSGNGTTVNVSLTSQTWSGMLSGKLYPLASAGMRFQPYAKVGMGYLAADVERTIVCNTCSIVTSKTSADEGGFAFKWGGGADIHITPALYVYVDYGYFQAVSEAINPFDFHALGAGIGYRW